MPATPVATRRSAVPGSPLFRGALTAVAFLLLVLPFPAADAEAGTAKLAVSGHGTDSTVRLSYEADPAERNSLNVFLDWSDSGDPLQTRPDPASPPTAYVVNDRSLDRAGVGCGRLPAPNDGLIRCPIPDGRRPLGPRIWLGDRGDFACVAVALPEGGVTGGHGDDDIRALGRLSGGPGDDSLVPPASEDEANETCHPPGARSPSGAPGWVSGGLGDDYIEGGGQVFGGPGWDVIDLIRSSRVVLGPGLDEVYSTRGSQLIHARDSEPDIIYCSGRRDRETVLADGLDVPSTYEGRCEQWRRRGVARAAPISLEGAYDMDRLVMDRTLSIEIVCPPDGPSVCVGEAAITVPGGRRLAPVPFRVKRNGWRYIDVRIPAASRHRFAVDIGGDLDGRDVRVTVWSRDRAGIVRRVRTVLWLYLEGYGESE